MRSRRRRSGSRRCAAHRHRCCPPRVDAPIRTPRSSRPSMRRASVPARASQGLAPTCRRIGCGSAQPRPTLGCETTRPPCGQPRWGDWNACAATRCRDPRSSPRPMRRSRSCATSRAQSSRRGPPRRSARRVRGRRCSHPLRASARTDVRRTCPSAGRASVGRQPPAHRHGPMS